MLQIWHRHRWWAPAAFGPQNDP